MTYTQPFGINLTQKFCDFMGFSFTAEDYVREFKSVEDGIYDENEILTQWRKEIHDGLKSVPRNLIHKFRNEFNSSDGWPSGDDQMMGYSDGSYRIMTYREAFPDWTWNY